MAIPYEIIIRRYMATDSGIAAIVGEKVSVSPVPANWSMPYLEIDFPPGGAPLHPEAQDEMTVLAAFSCWGGLVSPNPEITEASMVTRTNLRGAVIDRLYPVMQGRVNVAQFTAGGVTYGPYDLSLGRDLELPTNYTDLDSQGLYSRMAWRIRISTAA